MRARKQRTKRRERKREGEKKRIPRTHLQIDATKHPLFELEGHGGKRGAKKKRGKRGKRECKKRVRRVYITVHKRTRVRGWNRHGSN